MTSTADAAGIVRQLHGLFVRVRFRTHLVHVHVGVHFHHGGLAFGVLVGHVLVIENHVLRQELGICFRAFVYRLRVLIVLLGIRRLIHLGEQAQVVDDGSADVGKLVLIEQHVPEPFDVAARVLFHVVAPEADHVLRRRRQLPTGQLLPDKQANGNGQRRLGFRGDAVEGRFLALDLERGFQVLRHPFHAVGADGGHPGVLDPLKHLLGGTAARRAGLMQRVVVETQAQGELVAHAAHRVDLFRIGAHGRQGHPYPIASNRRWALAKAHLQLLIPGDGADGGGGGALERLQWVVLLGHLPRTACSSGIRRSSA